jgi:hypothetical protein
VGRKIGGLELGETRARTIAVNGEPMRRKRGFLRYCIIGGGKYMAGWSSRVPDASAEFLLTSNPGFHVRNVRRLTPVAQMHRRLRGEELLFRTAKTRVWVVRKRYHDLLVIVRQRRVAALASTLSGLSRKRVIAHYKASK